MINYKTFETNINNLHTLAPILIKELNDLGLADDKIITVAMMDLKGREIKQNAPVSKVREMLNNPKMNDIAISSMEMKFEVEL